MTKTPPKTPLLAVLRTMNVDEQNQFAKLAGTTRNYLYQLGSCNRTAPRVALAKRIAEASVAMHIHTLGRSPKLTMDQLASMCAIQPKAETPT